jgi:hypothetical protein
VTSIGDLARLRLAAQRIVGPGQATAADVVAWMTALQAQDFPGALNSVALRIEGGTRADVEAALDAGDVVRSWPMRGTLHLVPAVDLAWLLTLGPPRVATTVARRQRELGIDDVTLERAEQVAVDALRGRQDVTRNGLMKIWNDTSIETTGQRGYHLLIHLAHAGIVCFGPMHDGQQATVLVDEWIPGLRHLERDEALGELVVRYFRSHGPARVKDFTWWTGLRMADAAVGMATAATELERIEVDGVEYFMDPATPDRLDTVRAAAKGVFLLPGFDEFVLGYGDRSAALPAEFADQLAPGGNGMFRPSVVADGQIVGTWRRPPKGDGPPIATPFTAFTRAVESAILHHTPG